MGLVTGPLQRGRWGWRAFQSVLHTVPGTRFELPVEVDIVKNLQVFAACTGLQNTGAHSGARLGTFRVTSLTQSVSDGGGAVRELAKPEGFLGA